TAKVCGNALVCGSNDWLLIGPAKSSSRFTTANRDEKLGVRINCGCFTGDFAAFTAAIEKTHADNPEHLAQYRAFCQLIATHFNLNKEQPCKSPSTP
ncbi:MAG: hypothetical protein Q4A98_06005, partial [Comamonadaceae bacterium]|nr:hypothetical protein [Comamonadaceae bacterium]